MEKRIAILEKTMISLAKDVQEIKTSLLSGFMAIDNNFKKINTDLSLIEKKLNKLQGNTSTSLKKVDGKLDDLKTEIKNIGKVTGYDEMISNLKIVGGK